MTTEWFRAYLDAFNMSDFERLRDFFAQDVVFEHLPPLPRLEGRDALFAFYRDFKRRVSETIEPLDMILSETGIAAEVRGTFTALQDMPDFPATPLRRGETFTLRGVVFYRLRAGRFVHIRNVARIAAVHRALSGETRDLVASGQGPGGISRRMGPSADSEITENQ